MAFPTLVESGRFSLPSVPNVQIAPAALILIFASELISASPTTSTIMLPGIVRLPVESKLQPRSPAPITVTLPLANIPLILPLAFSTPNPATYSVVVIGPTTAPI